MLNSQTEHALERTSDNSTLSCCDPTRLNGSYGECTQRHYKRYEILEKSVLYKSIVHLKSGVAGIQHVLSDGRRSISALFVAGDIIDLRHHDIVRNGDFVSLSKTVLNLVSGVGFDRNTELDLPERRAVEDRARRQFDFLSRHCADLGKKTAAEKFSSYLFECCRRQMDIPKTQDVGLLLQRVDIADYLGVRPETLSRVIAKMERIGLIRIAPNNRFCILDAATLRQVANGSGVKKELAT